MRETKEQRLARAERDNAKAAVIPAGTKVHNDLFGEMVLGAKTDAVHDGWEHYTVQHSGVLHQWSSAVVVTSFGGAR